MNELGLIVSFGDDFTRGSLILEQEEYDPFKGKVSKEAVLKHLASFLTGDDAELSCFNDEFIHTAIYAYPYPVSLAYTLSLVGGSMGGRIVQDGTMTDKVGLALDQTTYYTKYPPVEVLEVGHSGRYFNVEGVEVSPPAITITDDGFTLDNPCYGVVFVKYRIIRHKYNVTAPFPDNGFPFTQSLCVAYAQWDKGLETLVLDIDKTKEGDACGYSNPGSDPGIEQPDCDEPTAYLRYKTKTIDYCSGEES